MEEVTLLDFNKRRGGAAEARGALSARGHVLLRQPVHRARRAVGEPAERAGGAALPGVPRRARSTPEAAARSGFRPADLEGQAGGAGDGGERRRPEQPERVLGLPEPRVLDRVKQRLARGPQAGQRAARARHLGLDERREPAERAKEGLQTFFDEVAPQDRVGLTIFTDRIQPLVPDRPVRAQRSAQLRRTVDGLIADGGTAIYDATPRRRGGAREAGDTSASTPSCC